MFPKEVIFQKSRSIKLWLSYPAFLGTDLENKIGKYRKYVNFCVITRLLTSKIMLSTTEASNTGFLQEKKHFCSNLILLLTIYLYFALLTSRVLLSVKSFRYLTFAITYLSFSGTSISAIASWLMLYRVMPYSSK